MRVGYNPQSELGHGLEDLLLFSELRPVVHTIVARV